MARAPCSAEFDGSALGDGVWGGDESKMSNDGEVAAQRSRREEEYQEMQTAAEGAAEVKEAMRRSADNSRGWYNDELTKQRRDWKEGLDFGSTYAQELDSLKNMEEDGLIHKSATGLTVTELGRLLIRNIAMQFDGYQNERKEGRFSKTI